MSAAESTTAEPAAAESAQAPEAPAKAFVDGGSSGGTLTARAVALQRRAGNRAATRVLQRQPTPPTKPAPGHSDLPPDEVALEWIIPPAVAPGQLAKLMLELRTTQAKSLKDDKLLARTSYLVLGASRLYHYDPSGKLHATYALQPKVETLNTGYYLGALRRYDTPKGPSIGGWWMILSRPEGSKEEFQFHTLRFDAGKAPKPTSDWLVPADAERFGKSIASLKTPFLLLAVPPGGGGKGKGEGGEKGKKGGKGEPPPDWADKLAKKATADVRAKVAEIAAKAGKQDVTGAKGTAKPTDPELKKLPDRLVPWSDGEKAYVNVWAEGEHKAVELKEGETPQELLDRVAKTTEELRRQADPAQSIGVRGGAKETKIAGEKPLEKLAPGMGAVPYDPDRPPMQNAKAANLPQYPSSITMAGAEPSKPEDHITVVGGTNQFRMAMDWSQGGRDSNLLSLVTAQMQFIEYRWELIKVEPGDYKKQIAEAKAHAAGTGETVGKASGERADIRRAMNAIEEDTKADLEDMDSVPWALRSSYLSVIGLSVAVRTLGSLLSAFASRLTTPLDEQKMSFSQTGDYVVRCIATPLADDDAKYRRASSISSRPVRIVTVRERAKEVASEAETRIAKLEELKKHPPEDRTVEEIQKEIDELRRQEGASHSENAKKRVADVEQLIRDAQELRKAEQAGTPVKERSVAARELAVRLAFSQTSLDSYTAALDRTLKELKEAQGRVEGYGVKGTKGPTYSPRVTLASEENGRAYSLVTVLGQTKTLEKDGVCEWRLADVTSKGQQQAYYGQSREKGQTGNQAAIRAAFIDFKANNGYGRGTINIRIPADLEKSPEVGGLPMEREMRSAPGDRERALQKLRDIATVAEVAGLIVGGPVGLAIGAAGGLAGGILAAENIRKRVAGDRFELLSWDTFMDVVGLVGSVAGVGGAIAGGARMAGSAARWAVAGEKAFMVVNKGMLAGQVVILPATAYRELAKLEAEIKAASPPMTPGEIRLRRAEILSRFMWGTFTTSVGAAQMMGMPALIGDSHGAAGKGGGPGEPPTGPPKPVEPPVVPSKPVEPPTTPPRPVEPPTTPPKPVETPPTRPVEPPGKEPLPAEGGGGGHGKPPAPPTPPPPGAPPGPKPKFRVIEARDFWTHVKEALGPHGDAPQTSRIKMVERSIIDEVHRDLTGAGLPEKAMGMYDPVEKTLYVAKDAFTTKHGELLDKTLAGRISPHARKALGPTVSAGVHELLLLAATGGSPKDAHGGAVTRRLAEVVGIEGLKRALYDNDLGAVREPLVERFGSARANAIEAALRGGHDLEALVLMDPPNNALANAYGSYLVHGIADIMATNAGGQPRNAQRARLAQRVAELVGFDVLRRALLEGDVAPVRQGLETALGADKAKALTDALVKGNERQIAGAFYEPLGAKPHRPLPRLPPPPEQAAPAAAREAPRLGTSGRALNDGLAGGAKADAAEAAARAFIKEQGGFKDIRLMVESGRFGADPAQIAAAKEAIQGARRKITDEVLDTVIEKLKADPRYASLEFKRSDLGTPGFGSDRDVTIKAEPKPGREVPPNELVAASVEAVRDAYKLLNERGFPPDKSLDSNFYTELHESRIAPKDAAERARIAADQSVVSLAEMRMNMSHKQWEAYVAAQRRSLGGADPAHTAQRQLAESARALLDRQIAAAERLAGRLMADPAGTLKTKQEELLAALRADPPRSAQEIRQLMAEIKLLEPDAYGTRAAVEGVVDFQQALARAKSVAEAGPILKARPGRLGKRGLPTGEELAILSQEASASYGKLSHAKLPNGNGPTQAAAVSKYLSRVLQAYHEAGLTVRDPVMDRSGRVVAAKSESPAAVLKELKAWAEDHNVQYTSDAHLADIYVAHCERLGRDLVSRLRTLEHTAAAQERVMAGETSVPPPPPRVDPHLQGTRFEETAGSGGIRSISSRGNADGSVSFTVEGDIITSLYRGEGPAPVGKIKAREFNARFRELHPDAPTDHLGKTYEAAHLWGPGFGDEAMAGMMYAPASVNRELQRLGHTRGVEGWIQDTAAAVKLAGGSVSVKATATSHPNARPRDPLLLAHVEYVVQVKLANGAERSYRITIDVPPPPGTRPTIEFPGPVALE